MRGVTLQQKLTAGRRKWSSLKRSVWFFPFLLTILLLLLTVFKIHGSSIGVYNEYFYGDRDDSSLLLNKPRPIRSDEWLVATQMTIAQSNSSYDRINPNIGNGEDMSLLLDVPYKEWSVVFKPHNWVFFVLPFENAFAFRWWVIGYLLILSCYFFVLAMLPRRRMLAALLGISLFFGAFIQWWYLYGTLGSLYYCLFIATLFIYLLRKQKWLNLILLGLAGTYLAVSFALILYPPFQIPCALALGAFMLGYTLERRRSLALKEWLRRAGIILAAGAVAGTIVLAYINTRSSVVNTVQNTAYPGQREVNGGGFSFTHLFSGHLNYQLQFSGKAAKYRLDGGATNQSEASKFILIIPFLLLPALYLLIYNYRKTKRLDWPLITLSVFFLILLVRLFTPAFDGIFKLMLLSQVPHKRLLIGTGLLNIFFLSLFIRALGQTKKLKFNQWLLVSYALIVFLFELVVALYIRHVSPGFIDLKLAVLFSFPVPVIVYLLLSKKFVWSMTLFVAFSVITAVGVHPLYRGTGIVTASPLSQKIQSISESSQGRWAVEGIYLENFALLNGAPSLSGVYTYPQLELWQPVDSQTDQSIYNRYAHVTFVLDRDSNLQNPDRLQLVGGDHFDVYVEPCSDYLKKSDVQFLITEAPLSVQDTCATAIEKLSFPARTIFIYELR